MKLDFELSALPEFDADFFGFDASALGNTDTEPERKEADYNESISVVIDCKNDAEAEEIFNRLTEEGYSCRISTL